MPDEKNRDSDWLPSKEQWIAASAQNPDDFDDDFGEERPNEGTMTTGQETRKPD